MTAPAPAGILDEAAEQLSKLHGDAIEKLAVEQAVVGVFFTGVRFSDGSTGVAYTPPEMIQRASTRILGDRPRSYRGRTAAQMISSSLDGHFAPVVRLAALNALSAEYLARAAGEHAPANDLSNMPKLFTGRRVCMVGAIVPLLKKISQLGAAQIAIIDRKKETEAEAGLGSFVPLEQTAQVLSECQTAVLTGATIANGSIEELLGYIPADAAIAVVGPTAGFVPEPLFRRGVAVVGTVTITDGIRAMEIISEGGGALELFRHSARKVNLVNQPRLAALGLC
ncbi:MAG: DUF364 domain-containing protein [Acidobacteriota bacterium]|nr:DUF364 domain-containing protein [Acidobacteriota bacterium]